MSRHLSRLVDPDEPGHRAPDLGQRVGLDVAAAVVRQATGIDGAHLVAAAWVLLPVGTASHFFDMYAHANESAIRSARGLAALKSLFLMLMGQDGDRGLPGGKPNWGPVGRAAIDRVLKGV